MARKIIRLGRHPSCDIAVADETVSSFHAELEITSDGKLFVVDCNSANGTTLIRGSKKKQVTQVRVETGDTVRFGKCAWEASDLIQLVGDADPAGGGAPAPGPSGHGEAIPQGREIRCPVCFGIKAEGDICPNCGAETRGVE